MKPDPNLTSEAGAGRRRFLRSASLGGAGAVAAVVAGRSALEPAATTEPTPDSTSDRGYRVSDHVLQYYRSTRL